MVCDWSISQQTDNHLIVHSLKRLHYTTNNDWCGPSQQFIINLSRLMINSKQIRLIQHFKLKEGEDIVFYWCVDRQGEPSGAVTPVVYKCECQGLGFIVVCLFWVFFSSVLLPVCFHFLPHSCGVFSVCGRKFSWPAFHLPWSTVEAHLVIVSNHHGTTLADNSDHQTSATVCLCQAPPLFVHIFRTWRLR